MSENTTRIQATKDRYQNRVDAAAEKHDRAEQAHWQTILDTYKAGLIDGYTHGAIIMAEFLTGKPG